MIASIDAARHGISSQNGIPTARMDAGTDQAGRPSHVTIHLVEGPSHFDRAGIYNDPKDGKGYPDNDERFIFFQRAALELLQRAGFRPDVIHCHDHQTALIPAYLKMGYDRDKFFAGAATVFTQILVAQRREVFEVSNRRGVRLTCADKDIDDGLGCQTGDRGAAEVLEGSSHAAQGFLNVVGFLLEKPWPARVVGNDF